jgi:hypothetical protein
VIEGVVPGTRSISWNVKDKSKLWVIAGAKGLPTYGLDFFPNTVVVTNIMP